MMDKATKAVKATLQQETPELDVSDIFHDNSLNVGPEVSPYQSPSCTIYFRGWETFRIPHDLLRRSEELEKLCSGRHEIRLEDIPNDAGHVLIHYLHTGSWQTLRVFESTPTAINSTQLKVSLHVYAAARIYKLPALAEIAKEKVSHYAGRLPALEILGLASDVGQLLGEEDLWFSTFIRLRIQQLFEDPDSLNKKDLLGYFRSATTYTGMLVKGLIDICCEKSTMAAPSMGSTEPESDSVVVFTPDSETAHSIDSVDSKLEPAAECVEALPKPDATPSNVTRDLEPGSAVDRLPVATAEPVLTKKQMKRRAKKEKRIAREKAKQERAIADLKREAEIWLEPMRGPLIDAADSKLEPAAEFVKSLPEPDATPSNVTLNLEPGSAVDCAPVAATEPVLKRKTLLQIEKKKKKMELKKAKLELELAALDREAELWLEPMHGPSIDAAEPQPEPAVEVLLETEAAPSKDAETDPEPEPVPFLDWQIPKKAKVISR